MPDIESVSFEIDPRSVTGAIAQMNSDIERFEKGGTSANQRLQDSFERVSNLLLRMSDKQQDANLRLVRANELRAATYGRELNEVQRLIAQRDDYNKRLAGSEEAIKRNTAAFEQMISKAESSEGGGKFKEFGESIAQFIEQPMIASRTAVTGFLNTMGPVGGVVAGSAGALMAFAAAGYEAAKSVGEASTRVRDLEIRMGVTDKQAAELGFSAKAAGADVSVFERAMRGLTTAVEGTGTEGAKARQELGRFGVDLDGLKNGTAGTYDTLIKISEGLGSMSSPFERNAAGMDLFKKAWFEMAPALLDLRENSEYFQQHGIPVWTDADAKRGMEYLKWATSVEESWKNIKLHILDAVAGMAQFLAGGSGPKPSPMAQQVESDLAYEKAQKVRETNKAEIAPYVAIRDRQRDAFANTKEGLEDLLAAAKRKEADARGAYLGTEGMDPLRGAAKADAIRLAESWAKARTELDLYQTKLKDLNAAEKTKEDNLKASKKSIEDLEKLPGFNLSGAIGDQYAFNTLRDQMQVRAHAELVKAASEWKPESLRGEDQEFLKGLERDTKQNEDSLGTADKALKYNREFQLSQQEGAIRVGGILGGRQDSLEMARQLAAVKKAALDDQYRIELNSIAGLENADDKRFELKIQHAKDVGELEMKLAEQTAQETRRQFESIQRVATGLWETALTHPRDFGKQLAGTLRESMIKPVAEGLGGMTAQMLQPIIYGGGGGHQEPLKVSTDDNTRATRENTAWLQRLAGSGGTSGGGGYSSGGWGTNIFNPDFGGGSGGGSFGMPGAPGGTSGFAGPVFSTTGTASMPGGGGGGGGFGGFRGILGNLKGGWAGLGKAVGYGPNGWNTSPVKNSGGIDADTGQPTFSTSGGSNSFGTVAGSIASSPLAGTAGMMLAQNGILGERRGTWGGVAEATGGGALLGASLGMQFGGPVGAAIGAGAGAVAGFGISMAEMALGIYSPEEKAKRDVKSIYGISIDMQMARQIVQVAQSKYANNINLAVRSPDVRQMLGLYAAGTGQKMALSATTPMGGSIAEQGGKLYQEATYQYGKSYSYGGNLPVLGGPTQGTIPSASQPTSLSLNIQGRDLQSFMQGEVVTPDAIQSGLDAAWNSGNGRVSSSAAMLGVPNLLT